MAAGSTYTPIATTTLGSNTASYTFSSIPGTYTDLVLVINSGQASGGQSIYAQFNGDTGNNYSETAMWGDGSSVATSRISNGSAIRFVGRGVGGSASLIDNSITSIMNYANTNTFKTVSNRSNANAGVGASLGLWRSTAAITSIVLTGESGVNILSGSTLTLYGITAA
jgi:hypothetical protein